MIRRRSREVERVAESLWRGCFGSLCLVVGMLGQACEVSAQEREARWRVVESLTALATASEQDPQWEAWTSRGNLTELLHALDAGKLAEPKVVKTLATGVPGENSDEGRAVRTALAKWVALVDSPPRPRLEDWRLSPMPANARWPESLESLNEKLAAVTDQIQLGVETDGPWRARLRLDLLEKLLAGGKLSEAELAAVESGWILARGDWDSLAYRRAMMSVQRLLIAARRKNVGNALDRVRDAVRLLEDTTKSGEHAAAVRFLDGLDLASPWSVSWWAARRHPQLQVRLRPPVFKPQDIDETYEVNDVYAGTAVSGSGRFTGRLTLEWSQQGPRPQLELKIQGEAVSSTVGGNSGVTVQSSSRATVRGGKVIEWTERGFVARPATVDATARVSFDAIDPGGGRARRRNAAIEQVYATRPAAERDTREAVERNCRERLDQRAEQWLQEANDWIDRHYRLPLLKQAQFAPRVRTARIDNELSWECWYGAPEEPGASTSPPIVPASAWFVAIHEDFLARYFLTQCAGDATTETVSRLLGATSSSASTSSSPAAPPRRLRLATEQGCAVRVKDGLVTVALRVSELATDQGSSSTPFEIQATYQPRVENGALVLTRRDAPVIRILSGGATARAQTLKRLVARQSQVWFAQQAKFDAREWSAENETPAEISVSGLAMSDGWLVVSGNLASP